MRELSETGRVGLSGVHGQQNGRPIWTAPGLPEAWEFESGRQRNLLLAGIVARLGLCGRDVADRLEETVVVEPIHPFESGVFDREAEARSDADRSTGQIRPGQVLRRGRRRHNSAAGQKAVPFMTPAL